MLVDNCYWLNCNPLKQKYGGAAQWSCNVNLRLTKSFFIKCYDLKGYDSHLIMNEIEKVNGRI